LRKKLEIRDGLGTMPHRSSNAIVTGITTTDDDYILAFGIDIIVVL
jgi:hypothetical protein